MDCPSAIDKNMDIHEKTHPNTSIGLAGRLTQQGTLSSTGGRQRLNELYAVQTQQYQKGYLKVIIVMLHVFQFDVYALIDRGATLSFVTLYIAMKFIVSPEILWGLLFSVSTAIGESDIA